MTITLDKYDELDTTRMLQKIEQEIGQPIFDKYSVLDLNRAKSQIETQLDITLSNDWLLDPARMLSESQSALVPAGDDAPDWVPTGAAIYADFVNGRYFANSAVVEDPGEIFQTDPDDGVTFYPENITPDVGYVMSSSGDDGMSFIQSPDILVDGATFVFESEDANILSLRLIAYDAPDFVTFWQAVMAPGPNQCEVSIDGDAFDTGFTPTGRIKMAVNFSPAGLVASFHGRPIVSQTNGETYGIINRVTASMDGEGNAIRSIAVYPFKPDSELPGLSAA